MSAPDFPSQNATGSELEDRVRRDAAQLAETARNDLDEVASSVKQEAAAIGDEARAQIEKATEKAKTMAEEQKQLLVDQMSGVSSALVRVAGELEEQGESSAHYVRMIADGADRLTSTVRYNNVDDILAMAQDFGRKQPVAFMGAAALLGFVASRFVVASASRRTGQDSMYGQSQYQSPNSPSSYAAGTGTGTGYSSTSGSGYSSGGTGYSSGSGSSAGTGSGSASGSSSTSGSSGSTPSYSQSVGGKDAGI